MKRKILIALAVVVVAIVVGLIVQRERAERRATYQGIHASAWAVDFYPNFDPGSTNIATTAFHIMGSNAVPALRTMLKAREPWFGKLFVQQGKRLPVKTRSYLAKKIKPGQAVLRKVAAARALGVVGADATTAVPDLAAALGDDDVRWAAAQALASIGGQAIPALAAATTNKDVNVRHAAVYGLGQAGTNAWPATAVLLDRVLDTNESVQASAVYSLSRVGRSGLPVVLEVFSTDDANRRVAAIKAIKAMNTPPKQVVRTLLEFTTNSAPDLRQNSLEALRALRLNHPYVVAAYMQAINDPNAAVRTTAARALNQANVWATNAALGDSTVRVLGRSGNLNSNIVAALNGLLEDPVMEVRTAAQQTLASLQASTTN